MIKTKMETIKVNVVIDNIAGTQFIFTLLPTEVKKIKQKFSYTPAHHIVIMYEEQITWNYFLSHQLKNIEKIISLDKFDWHEVKFEYEVQSMSDKINKTISTN